ncbi:cadherin-like beta sandwich domain-containing protein [Paenibacillus sp.]|uniref:cadherin-like beta sandwich domain-containing protein n=1 Tax=Paenibacillus sp. TaxID=58172 RepID=UPI002811BD62|nr:cadherin-like beta sandwich domain-containing protein [Paenibacillus sp.]
MGADGTIQAIAGTGSAGFSGDGGQADQAEVSAPVGVAVDGDGIVYIADTGNNRIRKIATDGTISTVTDQVVGAKGVAVDGSGNVFVADTSNYRIKKVSAGGAVSTVAGTGGIGYTGDGGAADAATFNSPTGVAVDLAGNVYIADMSNHVIRMVGANPYLVGLTLSSGTLSPSFSSAVTAYTATVGNNVNSLTMTPTLYGSGGTVTVAVYDGNGTLAGGPFSVTSGAASSALPLSTGNNTISIEAPSLGGTTKTYTVTVTKSAAGVDADLFDLWLSEGILNPTFDQAITNYAVDVSNDVTRLAVTPWLSDGQATVTVNGVSVAAYTESDPIELSEGSNTIAVAVTAQDGITTKTYTITVTRAVSVSNNADLSGLTLSHGTLDPMFASGTTSYTADVGNAVASLTVTPTVSESHATVTVNGAVVASGSASEAIDLNVGSNTITVAVTAQDGIATKTYSITIHVDLANPAFEPDIVDPTNQDVTLTVVFPAYAATKQVSTDALAWTPYTAPIVATANQAVYARYEHENGGWSNIVRYDIGNIDKEAPTTGSEVAVEATSKYVTVAFQPVDGGSGIAGTYYKVDGGAEQTGNSVQLRSQGAHTIVYWSVDHAGNLELERQLSLEVQRLPIPTEGRFHIGLLLSWMRLATPEQLDMNDDGAFDKQDVDVMLRAIDPVGWSSNLTN